MGLFGILQSKRKNADVLDEEEKKQQAEATVPQQNGVMSAYAAVRAPIGKEQVEKATVTMLRYRADKEALISRVTEDEKWYRMRHWDVMPHKDNKNDDGTAVRDIKPTSAWLFNAISNKHADVMDNFPGPNILPREEGDKDEAKTLTSIIPAILEQIDFEKTYSEVSLDKLKYGTGVYHVFWDSSADHDLGSIGIEKTNILNLYWESGISDIQKSPNLFSVELIDNDALYKTYPGILKRGDLGESSIEIKQVSVDENIKTAEKSAVIDWYYKVRNSNGKEILHYCKYVNNIVLYASENIEKMKEIGYYEHAMYPYVFDVLHGCEGTPYGFGYIDIGKSAQEFIDRGNYAVMRNMLVNAAPRYFSRRDGGINEKEFADTTNDIVHVEGDLSDNAVRPIVGNTLPSIYVQVLLNKIDELKETTGNRDVSNGGTTGSVTAASAIAAMQEAGSKLSRDLLKGSYRAYKSIVVMMIELIRQFYDIPRYYRILGEKGTMEFVEASNKPLLPISQSVEGNDMGYRVPLFDVSVAPQKQSAYSKMAQNELALEFYGKGFFNPQLADQALACLNMMDFDRKDFVVEEIKKNVTLYDQVQQMKVQMIQLAQMVDAAKGTDLADTIAQQYAGNVQGGPTPNIDNVAGIHAGEESNVTSRARERAAEATAPV